MGFEDLPQDWSRRSLSDPRLAADVVDLVASEECRIAGALYVLMCDERGRLRAPIAVDDLPFDRPQECALVLQPFLWVLSERPGTSAVLALCRPGPPTLSHLDRRWVEAAVAECARKEVPLLGMYVAVPGAIVCATEELNLTAAVVKERAG
jgi:hypothetical protein